MNPQYTGARIAPKDKRDYQWAEVGFGSAPFDWDKGFQIPLVLNPKNQRESFSCGGQALAYYGEVLNYLFDKTREERSAKFIYAQSYYPQGGGSTIYDLAKTVKDKGWGTEALVPSNDNGKVTEDFMRRVSDITEEAFKQAIKDRALAYAFVDTKDIDAIAQAIRDNNGAIIGITGANNGTWLSEFPKLPLPTQTTWNHWLYACGAEMINGKKYIVVINSWGEDCGDKGYQWISEDFFKDGYVWNVTTLIYNTEPIDTGFKHEFSTDLYYKQTGKEIELLQKALQLDGCFPKNIKPTQFYGDITKKAVYEFQIKHGVKWAWWNRGSSVLSGTRKALNQLFNK